MDAGEDIILIVGAQILQFTEVVEGDGYLSLARVVELEVGGGDAVVGGQHAAHHVGGDGVARHDSAGEGEIQNVALEHGLDSDAAIGFADAKRVTSGFGDFVSPL